MYEYNAEYISRANGKHWLNVDLGFSKWKVVDMELNPPDGYETGDTLRIMVTQFGKGIYCGEVMKVLG